MPSKKLSSNNRSLRQLSSKKLSPSKSSVFTNDGFFKEAPALRSHFEKTFANPREANENRFIWDYWHIPGQYTALRTPAYLFFPKKTYSAFHNQLVWWGRRNLGCHDISPPWMSCYVDGCGQELHGDLPHGPWAFVYSLTPWRERKFRGGETILLKENILTYWQGFQSARGLERQDIIREVPALFNRLTVFDPRLPHGVRQVEGVHDVLQGRLVIHGWFVQPRPFIAGPLPTRSLQRVIDDLSVLLNQFITQGLAIQGTISLGFSVSRYGNIDNLKTLSNALRPSDGNQHTVAALIKELSRFLTKVSFGKQKGASEVTLPLIFEAN